MQMCTYFQALETAKQKRITKMKKHKKLQKQQTLTASC